MRDSILTMKPRRENPRERSQPANLCSKPNIRAKEPKKDLSPADVLRLPRGIGIIYRSPILGSGFVRSRISVLCFAAIASPSDSFLLRVASALAFLRLCQKRLGLTKTIRQTD